MSHVRYLWLIALTVVTGCPCEKPWQVHVMPTLPDRSCQTTAGGEYIVYIWECVDNQRVAIYGYSREACLHTQKEVTSCNEVPEIEKVLGDEVRSGCRPVPDDLRWR